MARITLEKTPLETLEPLRREHLEHVTAPLDGMWESFVEQGQHYAILNDGASVGYCVLNDQRQILQFHVLDESLAGTAFETCRQQLNVVGAVAATCDPLFFAQAIDCQQAVHVNALMYQYDPSARVTPLAFDAAYSFKLATPMVLEHAIAFAESAIGAPKDWLTHYYSERIERGELWLLWSDDEILAAGECRISPHQNAVADVGMVVAEAARGKGLATCVLQALVGTALEAGHTPICSTEADNIGAQKAIERAGFISRHRIIEFDF